MLLEELSEKFKETESSLFRVKVTGNKSAFVSPAFFSIEGDGEAFRLHVNTAAIVPEYALKGPIKAFLKEQKSFGLSLEPLEVLKEESERTLFRVRRPAPVRKAGKFFLYSVYEAASLFSVKAFNDLFSDQKKAYKAFERLRLALRRRLSATDVEVVADVKKSGPDAYEIEYSAAVLPSSKSSELTDILTSVFKISSRRAQILQTLNRSHWVLNPKMKERTSRYFNKIRIDFGEKRILVQQAERSPGPNIEVMSAAFLLLAKKATEPFGINERLLYQKASALYQRHQQLVESARDRGVAAGILAAFAAREPKRVVLVRAVKDILGKRIRIYEKTYSLERPEGSYSMKSGAASDFYLSSLTEKYRREIDRNQDVLFVGAPEIVSGAEDFYDLSLFLQDPIRI